MFNKILAVVSMAAATLFLSVGIASADDYVPPAVTSGVSNSSGAVQVLGTSQTVGGAGSASGSALSYTGTGFNVGGAVLIGAIVLLLGVGLCLAGTKMIRGRSAQR
ncbi:hypothetical protein SAMN04515671_0536 [Nakamurella panacisegetis]|uniref:LPXTG-motif cell wall anchor domain-containing protein n=1 Tax=Nakamurella panacisegetis TaxID=1090615 RepID=A0A1H0IJK4_9ACTN|nr:hypothetical protein [Nakamurella panacisegetis]SDO31654.1 hypothetical protein SAMN04515671_0536 [Nakamurella panacisegetis]